MEKIKMLFASRKFWAAFILVLMLILSAVFPGFPDLQDHLVELSVLVGSYILGTALDPGMPGVGIRLKNLFRSRKFITALAGFLVILLKAVEPDFPIDEAQMITLIVTLSAYILGTGIHDNITNPLPVIGKLYEVECIDDEIK